MSSKATGKTTSPPHTSSSLPANSTPPSEAGIVTPSSTSSESSTQRSGPVPLSAAAVRKVRSDDKMDTAEKDQTAGATTRPEHVEPPTTAVTPTATTEQVREVEEEAEKASPAKKKTKCKNPDHKSRKRVQKTSGKKAQKEQSDSDSSSDEESDEEEASSESSEEEVKRRKKDSKIKDKKRRRKSKKAVEESESETSDAEPSQHSSNSSSSEEELKPRKVKKSKVPKKLKEKKVRKAKKAVETADESDLEEGSASPSTDETTVKSLKMQLAEIKRQIAVAEKNKRRVSITKSPKSKTKSKKPETSPIYKRVDQLWDSTIHNFKLKESAEDDDSEFSEYAFLVRRTFDWENKYRDTVVDIKSKVLRGALAEVMKDCKSVSLEAEEPTIDPNLLFLYLEELRTYYKKTLKTKIKAEKKKKAVKKLESQRSMVKTLVGYIDEDYEDTKKTLYPLLKAGNITFDLIWALFKPNEIAVTSCYGVWDEPRCFKVEYANKCQSMTRGEWYCIEGRYLEYDGKSFGFGDFEIDVESFKGPRKITSLTTFPLKYHRDPENVKKQIIERGQSFINMNGMQYKFHKGLAFVKKKKQVIKININGRVMIDPATFRRVNPNYPISFIKPKDDGELFSLGDDSDDDSEDGCSCCDSDDETAVVHTKSLEKKSGEDAAPKYKYKCAKNDKGALTFVAVEVDENGDPIPHERVDKLADTPDQYQRVFTEEELLLTSPVMLGFAFSEKLWLEFTISGVKEIEYNENAFSSLVLPPNQKSIVRAQVQSHKFYAAKTIDDVVQGKGKGLVAVLHGPPGTGKTLTAEGIAELLKCPLYMVSAGELGTDPARLEHELQKILDIAHSWGAVLLLDEADVFLEKREVHDIHRNALVSIFLRLLEYFQGILFLTTNRVETFDDAFQSRIHIALRYSELTPKARKTVWKMFLDRVRDMDGSGVVEITDRDLDLLSRNQLNGRQIKNLVRNAQALALDEKSPLSMDHIKRVIEVSEAFDQDLKGGTGYMDAMRSYT